MTARRVAALVAMAAMAVALVVVPATTASAHALLLQTEPSPQTTVRRSPDAIRLHFSEAVEVTFGAVRIWVWTPAVRASGLYHSAADLAFRRRIERLLLTSWALLLLASAATLVFEAAAVSGLPLTKSVRPGVLQAVLHTDFGHYWLA